MTTKRITEGQKKLIRIWTLIHQEKGEVSYKELADVACVAGMRGQFIRKLYELENMGILKRIVTPINEKFQKVTVELALNW